MKMRAHTEKEKQKLLAASTQQVQEQENSNLSVAKNRQGTFDKHRQATEHSFTVAEMLVISRYIHKLKRDAVVGEELLKALRREEEKKRRDLIEARRERKKYEMLKEKQQAKYHQEVEKALTKESDEIAVSNFRYRSRNRRGDS